MAVGTVPCSAAVDPQSFGVYGRVWLERPVAGRFRPADSAFRGRHPNCSYRGLSGFVFVDVYAARLNGLAVP